MKSILFLLLLACPLFAADEAKLRAADDERVAAIIAGDRARLTAILSDELHYAHSSGSVDDKAKLIEAVASKQTKYVSIDYSERKFTFPAPGFALMTGRSHVKIERADTKIDMKLSFLGVWREENGQWRFLAWQSCKLPEATPASKK